MKKTSVVFLGDQDYVNSGSHAVERRRSLQANADFKTGFKASGAILKEAVAYPEGQGSKEVPKTQTFGPLG